MMPKDKTWHALIYISRKNWNTKETLTDEEVETQIAKCKIAISRKGNINVDFTLISDGADFPLDPVFNDFKMMSINRKYDCLVIPTYKLFASSSSLANMWIRDTLIPCGFRIIDAGARFDSLTCNSAAYCDRIKKCNYNRKSSKAKAE